MNEPYPPDGSPWYGQMVPVRFGSSFKTIAEQAVVGPNVNVAGGGGAFCAFTVATKTKNTTNQNSISSNAIRFFMLSFSFSILSECFAASNTTKPPSCTTGPKLQTFLRRWTKYSLYFRAVLQL